MKRPRSDPQKRAYSQVVAVIATPLALVRARRLRIPPDFFELRLDALAESLGAVATNISRLGAPIILTARHPAEGGLGSLSASTREELLRRFLEYASLVDLELRSIRQMAGLLLELRGRKISLVLSSHHFSRTPSVSELHRLTKKAATFQPAIFKLATRTDDPEQLDRLTSYLSETTRYSFPVAAMGMGRLGMLSRRQFDSRRSALTYVSLDKQHSVEGQLSLGQLRHRRRAYHY